MPWSFPALRFEFSTATAAAIRKEVFHVQEMFSSPIDCDVVGGSSASLLGYVDQEIRDTVRIGGGPLVVEQSKPISLTIINDEPLAGFCLGLISRSLDGGFINGIQWCMSGGWLTPRCCRRVLM